MKVEIYLLLSLCLLFSACSKNEPAPPVEEPPKWTSPLAGLPNEGRIQWSQMKVGQRSRYLYFEANGHAHPAQITPAYYQDTLVLAITGEDAQGFILTEFIIPDSFGRFNSDTAYLHVNHLKIEQDSVKFTRTGPYNSNIFAYKTHSLPLTPFATPLPEYPEATPFFGVETEKWEAFTQQHIHLGQTYGPLNLVYDYRDMAADGWGYLFAYDVPNGLVRFTWISWWSPDLAKGWDLLEE